MLDKLHCVLVRLCLSYLKYLQRRVQRKLNNDRTKLFNETLTVLNGKNFKLDPDNTLKPC